MIHQCSVQSILDHYQSCFYQFRVADLQAQLISGNHVRLLRSRSRSSRQDIQIQIERGRTSPRDCVIVPLRQKENIFMSAMNFEFLDTVDFYLTRWVIFARLDLSPAEVGSVGTTEPP